MKKKSISIVCFVFALALSSGCGAETKNNVVANTNISQSTEINTSAPTADPTATATPVLTATVAPTATPEPTNTPAPTEVTDELTSEDLVVLLKSFEGFEEFNDDQISLIIESEEFETQYEWGKLVGDIEGTLKSEFSGKENVEYLKKIIPALNIYADEPEIPETPAETPEAPILVSDNNKGGSDEDEAEEAVGIVAPDEEDKINEADYENTDPNEVTVETSSDAQYTFTQLNKIMYASSDVNFRKGPSTDYDKVGSLYAGEKVAVIAQCNETGWYLIKTEQRAEYVYVTDKYLTSEAPKTEVPVETPTEKPVETPSTNKAGTKVTLETYTVTGEDGNEITLENVEAEYVKCFDGSTTLVIQGLDAQVDYAEINNLTEDEVYAWEMAYEDSFDISYITDENDNIVGIKFYHHDGGKTSDLIFNVEMNGY